MTTVISEVYFAFKKIGIPEEDALLAAETLSAAVLGTNSNLEERLKIDTPKVERLKIDTPKVDKSIAKLHKEILVIKWMIGFSIAIQVVPLLRSLLT